MRKKFPSIMSKCPESMEDFFRREQERVTCLAAKFGIPKEEQEDFWMEIVTHFHRKDILNIFDPKKASWSTYLYIIVKNQAENYKRKLSRNVLTHSMRIVPSASEDDTRSKQEILADLVSYHTDNKDPVSSEAEKKVLFEQIDKHLRSKSPWGPEVFSYTELVEKGNRVYHKVVFFRRSYNSIFRLLKADEPQKHIAKVLGVSEATVSNFKFRLQKQTNAFVGRVTS